MVQLKVMIVGTSPAETLRMEEALQQAGCLDTFRYVGLEQALDRVPNWDEWDLLLVRYQDPQNSVLLALLGSVLRKTAPAIFFLIDPFDPVLVTRLLNSGARRVLPVLGFEGVIEANLAGVFGPNLQKLPLPIMAQGVWHTDFADLPTNGTAGTPDYTSDGAFADLFRSSPIGICINRLRDGICMDCNESFARLLDWPREALIGRDLPELGIPEDIQNFSSPNGGETDHRSPSPMTFERKIYTRERVIRHVQVHVGLMKWADEACLLSFVQDTTEKEQAKEKNKRLNEELERLVLVRTGALEAANRELAAEIVRRKGLEDFSNKLRQIIMETPDVVAIFDPDGRMQFLNKAGRVLFGLNIDESIDHLDLFSAYSGEMRRRIHDEIQPLVIQQSIWRGEAAFHRADGRVIPVSQVLLCKKDEDGKIQFYAFIARDVSDFKRVEQALRQSRERYRNLAEAAHDFIFMVSKDGLMEYANEFACQSLGFDPNQVYGLPVSKFFPKDFAANHLQMFNEVHEIDRPIYTEGPFFPEGHDSAWLGTWLVPIHSEDGGLASILGISRDITEQKKTDEALQRALQNERKLGEMRSNFFSMTSHQFRTPLSTILLSAELLQKYGQKWEEPKRAEHLLRIQDAAKRLNNMLEDILVIGRVESGRYACSPKEFDLIAFCNQTIREMAMNDHNEHELSFQPEMDHLMIYHDTEVMHRVIDNLLTNAIKYSPQGSSVTVRIKAEDRNIFLEVSDQGIGIPEQDMKYLFQPFQRGSNATDIPGTGIGLTIIQKSVDLMNGSISIKSKEGQGTTFMVRFPQRYENDLERILT